MTEQFESRRSLMPSRRGAILTAALALPGVDPIHKVSIIPRGIGSLGYTIQRPTEDRFLMTREELENKMAVSLGGRAAELIAFGHLSTGAADDLRRVTDIARSMVTRYGMSDKLGNVAYDRDPHTLLTGSDLPSPPHERDYAEKTAATVDEEVRAIVEKAFQRALDLLKERRAVLDRTAQRLLEKETLEEAELTQLVPIIRSLDRHKPLPNRTAQSRTYGLWFFMRGTLVNGDPKPAPTRMTLSGRHDRTALSL